MMIMMTLIIWEKMLDNINLRWIKLRWDKIRKLLTPKILVSRQLFKTWKELKKNLFSGKKNANLLNILLVALLMKPVSWT
jgi:hypothetical protein